MHLENQRDNSDNDHTESNNSSHVTIAAMN